MTARQAYYDFDSRFAVAFFSEAENLNQYRKRAKYWWNDGRPREAGAGGSGVVVESKDAPACSGEESSSFELSCNAKVQGGEWEDLAVSLA